jgi:hypothetical protein
MAIYRCRRPGRGIALSNQPGVEFGTMMPDKGILADDLAYWDPKPSQKSELGLNRPFALSPSMRRVNRERDKFPAEWRFIGPALFSLGRCSYFCCLARFAGIVVSCRRASPNEELLARNWRMGSVLNQPNTTTARNCGQVGRAGMTRWIRTTADKCHAEINLPERARCRVTMCPTPITRLGDALR